MTTQASGQSCPAWITFERAPWTHINCGRIAGHEPGHEAVVIAPTEDFPSTEKMWSYKRRHVEVALRWKDEPEEV